MGVLWKKNYPPVRGFYCGPIRRRFVAGPRTENTAGAGITARRSGGLRSSWRRWALHEVEGFYPNP